MLFFPEGGVVWNLPYMQMQWAFYSNNISIDVTSSFSYDFDPRQ